MENLLNKILSIEAKHALFRYDGRWYHHLNLFPGVLFDSNGYVRFESENHYLSHPDCSIGRIYTFTWYISDE